MGWIEAKKGKILEILPRVPKGGAVTMLNMLRFRAIAAYPDGRAGVSGRDAYAAYSAGASDHLADVGGKMIWFGKFRGMIIGPPEESWDHIFLVRYPSVERFVEMIGRPAYQEILVHRTAALADSRLMLNLEV